MKNKKLRDSAKHQQCTMKVAGVCRDNYETVVLAHVNTEGGCMGGKSPDYSACFACVDCHQWLDRMEGSEEDRLFYTRRAMVRTWGKWLDMDLVSFKGKK
jgi:hypothetical protein